LRVNDDLGRELFVVPFAFVIDNPNCGRDSKSSMSRPECARVALAEELTASMAEFSLDVDVLFRGTSKSAPPSSQMSSLLLPPTDQRRDP
jgi:hypothetical protein